MFKSWFILGKYYIVAFNDGDFIFSNYSYYSKKLVQGNSGSTGLLISSADFSLW